MIEIRDPIHGYIKLNGLAFDLTNTPQMQRLRWIKQLGLANLVYPGANHTRFEHSLGVYHLAGALSDHLQLKEDDRIKVEAAALLHDVGHGPLSHATEAVLEPYLRQGHEGIIELLRRGEMRDTLDAYGVQPSEVQSLIKGAKLGQIINSEIDVDRMDYLIRDAHYTGVAYGVIDHLRLIEKIKQHNGRLTVESGGIQAATSLLISRLLMHPAVYFHHVSRISECMISGGIRRMIEDGSIAQEIKGMDDSELFTAMAQAGGYAAEMVSRIKSRRLFKRAVYVGQGDIDSSLLNMSDQRIAQEIADEAGISKDYVLVDNPPLAGSGEGDFPALLDQDIKPLRDVSPLVAILESAHRATWRFGIYASGENREKVADAARRCLNLKKSIIQHTFADID